jgi:hypothetical protein
MIWFTWRQFRVPILSAVGVLVVAAVLLGVSGEDLRHLYDTTVPHCKALGDCTAANATVSSYANKAQIWLNALVIAVPALLGIFWGAPLVARELETGTYRVAWTQSVSRTRWIAGKVLIVGVAGVIISAIYAVMTTWWFSPIDRVGGTPYANFESRDVVPVACAVFALGLGVFLGTIIRRVVPAMAATLAVFVPGQLAIYYWVRPKLLSPLHKTGSLTQIGNLGIGLSQSGKVGITTGGPGGASPPVSGAWVYSADVVNKSGQVANGQFLNVSCPGLQKAAAASGLPGLNGPGIPAGQGAASVGISTGGHSSVAKAPVVMSQAFQACIQKASLTYHAVITYQPSNRYWPLQFAEAGVFVALGLALIGLTVWWVNRRIA